MRHGAWVALVLVLGVGCGGGSASAITTRPTGPDVGAPEGGNTNHVAEVEGEGDDAVATSGDEAGVSVTDEILVTGHGFTPQVVVREGTAGSVDPAAARDGSSLDPSGSCVGTFPASAQHIVKLERSLDVLRVLVHSPNNDLTLAVRTSDGAWHCNDDSGDPMNGLNPTVELYSPPPGIIEIWVGTYSSYYTGAQYRLGVTEQFGYASDFLGP
ncbi:MAG: hypothetical protein U0234_30615 [Sandaracinus sp.]